MNILMSHKAADRVIGKAGLEAHGLVLVRRNVADEQPELSYIAPVFWWDQPCKRCCRGIDIKLLGDFEHFIRSHSPQSCLRVYPLRICGDRSVRRRTNAELRQK